MIECCRFSYTSYTDIMGLTLYEYWDFRRGLMNVLEREMQARKRD